MVKGTGNKLPNRHIWHAVEGFGKTSMAAQAPGVIFSMTQGETGLETLIDAGRLPQVPHFPECSTWVELQGNIQALTNEEHPYRTWVLDTMNGAERLCHAFVTARDFDGSTEKFLAYSKGPDIALPEWTLFLSRLDKLRETRKMAIICLSHTKVKPFKNPTGVDYDRFTPDMHEKTWGQSHKWADVVLFGNFESIIIGGVVADDDRRSRKGKGLNAEPDRVVYAERRPAFDAKNRIGLPSEFAVSSDSPKAAWNDFLVAVKQGRANAPVEPQLPAESQPPADPPPTTEPSVETVQETK